mgnify:CR=1 FL=1
MKQTIILFLLFFLTTVTVSAQDINDKIDSIFKEWNQQNQPGGVVSIMKKDKVFFSKAYGKANIKYKIPNKIESIFNIGSVSKQFTAMGIVLLHLENKLSFEDDIRKYLPELKKLNKKISIRHLLHHTSGIRSTPELFGLAGWRDGDVITTGDVFNYLCKQTSLNFEPGSEFSYTNSGYILLAKIIERITKQPFNVWMKDNVFTPLDMANTFVNESNDNSNINIATPYYMIDKEHYVVAENTSLDIGASNIYSTATDLTRWMQNFNSPSENWKKAFSLLQTIDPLNNGDYNNYAFGVFVDDFKGNKRIQHEGGVPGYLSFTMYYPEEELTIVILSNFISRETNAKNIKLSELFLKNKLQVKKQKIFKPVKLKPRNAQKYIGDYWNNKGNYSRKIQFENDTLWYVRTNRNKSRLNPIGKNKFQIGGLNTIVTIEFQSKGEKKMILKDEDNSISEFIKYEDTPLTEKQLQEYAGSYYSPELETKYTISLVKGNLIGYHSRHGQFPIELLKKDITDWSGFAISKYKRDNKGNVIAISVSLNRVNNVWFYKK